MNKTIIRQLRTLLLAVIAFFVLTGYPKNVKGFFSSDEKSESFSGLTIQLSSEKDIYLPGEPVVFTLQLENRTLSPVPVRKTALDMRYGWITPKIAYEDGTFRTHIGPQFGIIDAFIRPSQLDPGKKITTSFQILYNVISKLRHDLQTNYAFSRPGAYLVRLRLDSVVPEQIIYTEPVRIEITSPKGADAAVWKLLQTKDAASFLNDGSPFSYNDTSIAKEFEQIIARYPDSTYTPHMRRSLKFFSTLKIKKRTELSRRTDVELLDINDSTLILKTRTDNKKRSGKSDIVKEVNTIIKLTDLWKQAYNTTDIPQLIQCISRKRDIRREWDRSSGRERNEIVDEYMKTFPKGGAISISIVRITFEETEATADIAVSYKENPDADPFQKMTFTTDDDGAWRIIDFDIAN